MESNQPTRHHIVKQYNFDKLILSFIEFCINFSSVLKTYRCKLFKNFSDNSRLFFIGINYSIEVHYFRKIIFLQHLFLYILRSSASASTLHFPHNFHSLEEPKCRFSLFLLQCFFLAFKIDNRLWVYELFRPAIQNIATPRGVLWAVWKVLSFYFIFL